MQIWIGADKHQTRLSEVFAERVKLQALDPFLDTLFGAYAEGRQGGEGFGDWVARAGLESVRAAQAKRLEALQPKEPVAA